MKLKRKISNAAEIIEGFSNGKTTFIQVNIEFAPSIFDESRNLFGILTQASVIILTAIVILKKMWVAIINNEGLFISILSTGLIDVAKSGLY